MGKMTVEGSENAVPSDAKGVERMNVENPISKQKALSVLVRIFVLHRFLFASQMSSKALIPEKR